jgi:hypothetical protein
MDVTSQLVSCQSESVINKTKVLCIIYFLQHVKQSVIKLQQISAHFLVICKSTEYWNSFL